ncbi:bifunctional 23S rRNA (guanine(2069)-N(7))-methyltransferase RlmK/23S rRNA (guanine(2445)-N(2))-methyltransferase RlmL [Psittacicella hinzii]|uniref:23S rRNA (Guanine(2445)-N(2))/(Guanine(2069)-N(7))-methyltransferase n=1 Tax=Psittacicella hinzii TaxID=2028575 RepID=A0A3A1YBP6_9GAMM|nr:bifunctional 23S rRNA (guanine(2069)-N(7))-methyltransferase RlmK/23S rRNA (guanine(2445)-N(2))-methyltransferase RlmL [Psittacicella hinzii]RIY35693.1 23S rRNA (guanine(2445)-N(2))/(guanine(2069)-N(7))-methyltransferase [Psittacicella hinzii]
MSQKTYHFFISCQIGFEEMVKQELLHLLVAGRKLAQPTIDLIPSTWDIGSPEQVQALYHGLSEQYAIQVKVGGVSAKLELYQAYQFMLWSRVAARTLLVLNTSYVEDDLDLYNSVYAMPWSSILHPGFDFKVNFNGTNAALKNSQFSALRVKDALVDYYVNQQHERPNVSTEDPDVVIDCRLHNKQLQIALDLTGTMHKRYRSRQGFAPMRETLAANLILRTGWDKVSPVYNPMCGSGVLAIEAVLIALNIAPGLFCEQHHLDYWQGHDLSLWIEVQRQAKNSRLSDEQIHPDFKVYASDNDKAVLIVAQQNADYVGVTSYIDFKLQDITQLQRQEQAPTGLVIVNPPYGVRLANERELYHTYYNLGNVAKRLFPGWIMGVISSSTKLLDCLSLAANRKWNIKNSNLDCQYRVYSIRNAQDKAIKASKYANNQAKDTASLAEQVSNTSSEQTSQDVTSQGNIDYQAYLQDEQAMSLYNRLVKNAKRLNSYLKRAKVENYRLYDADIPEFNVAVDVYTDSKTQQKYYVVQEYAATKEIPLHKSVRRGLQALAMVQKYAIEQAKGAYTPQVIDKLRQRQKGDAQYTKINDQALEILIDEYGCTFKVNLTDYIDTGIFLDNRDLRYYLRSLVVQHRTRFLNLFAYTSTASVHVIKAQAATTKSIDMSNSYCKWSAENFSLNKAKSTKDKIVQSDVLAWLEHAAQEEARAYDLIFCDPPTFSNSKRMEGTFDVQRDHVSLISKINQLLAPGGTLIFCNNKRGFKLDTAALEQLGLQITDITRKTMPADFADSKIHQAWQISKI